MNITAVVVTYNRKDLLIRCLLAMARQTRKPDIIIVVDNASTDGTIDMLDSNGWLARKDLILVQLPTNCGGAGGFAKGLTHALTQGADWAWMMDDDAMPEDDALEVLINRELHRKNIYASVAVSGTRLSWPMVPRGRSDACIFTTEEISEEQDVDLVPFIGILISKELVQEIGLPDEGFFLVADDVEYCFRAREVGARIVLVGKSRVNHPASSWYNISLCYRKLHILRLAPWKRYYEVRNRFLLHKYYGCHRLSIQNYIGWLLRLIGTLRHEEDRMGQLRAYLGGLIDGTRGRKGKRHTEWGL